MLLRLGEQPQRWAIDAAATTSMGHGCGCPARRSSIDVPSLLLRSLGLAAKCPVRQSRGPQRRAPGTKRLIGSGVEGHLPFAGAVFIVIMTLFSLCQRLS